MELILASASRYRRALLDRLGVEFIGAAHRCDERGSRPVGVGSIEVARALARAKAASLAEDYPDAVILGSDQLVDLDGEIFGKPGTEDEAAEQLRRLAGREHRLVTAVALRRPDGSFDEALDVHRMRMRSLTPAEIERYVTAERPLDCCGGYKVEGLGVTLFESMAGDDSTAMVGLPLMAVAAMLRRVGFQLP